jgi:hypothetical protein
MSKEYSSLASVSRIIAHASFCPMHLCRPSKKGSKASSRSAVNGLLGKKRSGTNESGCVKLLTARNVGYWLTETRVYTVRTIIKRKR